MVALGDFPMLLPDHEQVYAFTRNLGRRLACSCSSTSPGRSSLLDLPDAGHWADAELVLDNLEHDPSGPPAGGAPLRPWEARVHRVRT